MITNEDLWRSGAVSVPEALRMAPGLFVGRFSGSSWDLQPWFCREHASPQKRNVTVLALTAYAGEQARESVLRAGFNGYLSKPLDPAVVSRTIAASLS